MADVIVNNLKILIAELKGEAKSIAKQITSANSERNVAIEGRKEAIMVFQNCRKEYEELSIKQKDIQKEIDFNQSKISELQSTYKNQKEELKKDFEKEKKESAKELNHLNNFILNARQEEEKLKDIIFLMEEKIKGKQEAFEEIISLENTIKELNKKKIILQFENNSILSSTKQDILILKKEMDDIFQKIKQLKLEAEYAQINKQKIDNEATMKVNDLAIYQKRIQREWNATFPGRNMLIK